MAPGDASTGKKVRRVRRASRPRTEQRPSTALRARLRSLSALLLDCDGVLTPNDLIYDEAGKRQLRFHAKDGLGLALLCKSGFPVAVISGRPTDIAEARMRELGVKHFIGRCHDKGVAVAELCAELGIRPASSAFVGDDLPDLAAFERCGLKIAVADAAPELRAAADWVTRAEGGRGAVREVCEALLKARGEWPALLARMKGAPR